MLSTLGWRGVRPRRVHHGAFVGSFRGRSSVEAGLGFQKAPGHRQVVVRMRAVRCTGCARWARGANRVQIEVVQDVGHTLLAGSNGLQSVWTGGRTAGGQTDGHDGIAIFGRRRGGRVKSFTLFDSKMTLWRRETRRRRQQRTTTRVNSRFSQRGHGGEKTNNGKGEGKRSEY